MESDDEPGPSGNSKFRVYSNYVNIYNLKKGGIR